MKYYKIIINDEIIGAVNSKNFVRFSPVTHSFLRANESRGEFVNWKDQFYRDTWMKPVKSTNTTYTQAHLLEINEEEYNAYIQAFDTNDTIEYDHREDDPVPEFIIVDPIEDLSIDFIRSSKISAMSYECRKAIENGIDINIRGENRHFSLTTQDQLNLMSLSTMAQTSDIIPYHADDEQCVYYTAAEINTIIAAMNKHKIYHTTYYNALKSYINSLTTIESITAITYGTPIPDEYKTEVLKVIDNEA